jgi:hypothetical protein
LKKMNPNGVSGASPWRACCCRCASRASRRTKRRCV